ncbi:DoxX family protein [Hymenobacter arizonensis]|uniref:DoxX-like family protein n=1 Tax=Hymenobacter arizonensis TaxID=1227077 RepID=A0A1I5ZT44_HYMAR|nr:DoxX family protein [Hymenobacter arizonensis]SFQ59602.1 DoxX-like family protein [Hymenobacter arizonensis]
MKPKTTIRLYWGLTGLFSLLMLADGAAGALREANGQAAMQQLGYPVYLLTIVGTAKIFGALALLQPYSRVLKEWAFAGFTINFIGASASWYFSEAGAEGVLPPLVALALLLGLRSLWKNYLRTTTQVPSALQESAFISLPTSPSSHATA